ncbi:MAG: helix-turn-helix domain-containing protein [Gracilibacteraceae bacterium]|jgi:putative transcriptional regulator|nr:helix-turn-helix domain-containing protein [Gracilibacteraceae bacterium]
MSKMGQELIESMQELVDYSAGKMELRTSRMNVYPVRKMITPDEIRDTRKNLGMTQAMFAVVIGVSKKTVESWETGRYTPDGAARRLITILQADRGFPERYGIVGGDQPGVSAMETPRS